MWAMKRMLKIAWDSEKDNKSIVEELEEPARLSILWKKRIMGCFGHVAQKNKKNLEKDILFGKVPGKGERERDFLPGC